jgi:hypothetical protein
MRGSCEDAGSVFPTIVCGSDGSVQDDAGLDWVARLAAAERATLWVVHVAPRAPSDAEETTVAALKARVRTLRGRGLDASLYVIRGAEVPVGAALAGAARAVGADLVAVGTGGGVLAELMAVVDCPVLALPAPVSLVPAPAAAR